MSLASSYKMIFPTLALLASFFSMNTAALAEDSDRRTISLSVTGSVETTPDKVDIATGVTSEGQTARDALDKNTEAMSKVVAGLKDAGIDPKDIQTSNFSISPIYERKKQGQAAFITGYRVTNQVHITVRDTEKLGEILDRITTLGANEIGSIAFGVSEPDALEDEARKDAMRQAIANAQLYAEAASVELGPVLTIMEESGGFIPRGMEAAAPMAMAKNVPIEAGTTKLEVRLRVTWELR